MNAYNTTLRKSVALPTRHKGNMGRYFTSIFLIVMFMMLGLIVSKHPASYVTVAGKPATPAHHKTYGASVNPQTSLADQQRTRLWLHRWLQNTMVDTGLNNGELTFVQSMTKRFKSVKRSNFMDIWKQARKNGINAHFSAAIAWKETGFQPHETSYVGARGEYQLMDSTAKAMGVHDPRTALYNPKTAIEVGNKYLHVLFDDFNGHGVYGFRSFRSVNLSSGVTGVTFNGYLLRDQNGQAVPISLLVAMAYNGGSTTVYNAARLAAKYHQPVIIDPRSQYASFNYQQLDYVRKIAANHLYNFQGYHFSYSVNDVPQNKLA